MGRRTLYLLKTGTTLPGGTIAQQLIPRRTDLSAHPPLTLALIRLAAMALMMLAPLLAVVACFVRPLPMFKKRQP